MGIARNGCIVAEDKDESGFASIDELDAKSAKVRLRSVFIGCEELPKYPLVNVYITMENHHFQWVNPL